MSVEKWGLDDLVEIQRNRYWGACGECGEDLAIYIVPDPGEGVPILSQGIFYSHNKDGLQRKNIYTMILRCTGCRHVVGRGDSFMLEQ